MLNKSKMKNNYYHRVFGTPFINKEGVESEFLLPCFRYTNKRAFDTPHRAFDTPFTVLLIHHLPCFRYTKSCKSFIINTLQNPQYSMVSFYILLLARMLIVWKTKIYNLRPNFFTTGRKRKTNIFKKLQYV